MNVRDIPGYPVSEFVHHHMDGLINTALFEQSRSVHPRNHGGGTGILFREKNGGIHIFGGASVRDPDQTPEIRECSEKLALGKLMDMFGQSEDGVIEALAVSAAVRTNKDTLCQILRVRPPCVSCRPMLGKNRFMRPTTPIIMINPGKNLVIHQAAEIFDAYGERYWD